MKKIEFPYKYICIEGNLGAGKTTLSKLIAERFACNLILEEFADNPFLPYFYENPDRHALTVELFFLTERHKQLNASSLQSTLFSDFTLADYTIIKSLLFAKSNLAEEEFKLYQRIYTLLTNSIPKPNIILYIHRSIETIKSSIIQRGRTYEMSIDEDYLQKIQSSYFDFFKTQTLLPVVVLDAENLDFVENPKHLDEIIRILSTTYNPGLHHVRLLF